MKRFHLIFGILALVVFILTGQYMARFLNSVGMDIGIRLLYRTRHIFILLSSLSHIVIGVYFVAEKTIWRRRVQYAGSALLATATLFFLAGFFIEPPARDLETPWTHWGTYAALAGTLAHLSGVSRRKDFKG